jgi:hypothetical protein
MSATGCARACKETDLAGRRVGWIVWGVPAALMAIGIAWGTARPWLWIPSLVFAGAACVANASRCGRLHCFVTGPVFLLAAIAALLDATHVVAIAWPWILVLTIAGTAAGYGLEWMRGKYVGPVPADEGGRS